MAAAIHLCQIRPHPAPTRCTDNVALRRGVREPSRGCLLNFCAAWMVSSSILYLASAVACSCCWAACASKAWSIMTSVLSGSMPVPLALVPEAGCAKPPGLRRSRPLFSSWLRFGRNQLGEVLVPALLESCSLRLYVGNLLKFA